MTQRGCHVHLYGADVPTALVGSSSTCHPLEEEKPVSHEQCRLLRPLRELGVHNDDNGVLTMRFHTKDGPIVFTGTTHEDLPFALEDIALDEDNRAMILTGTDDVFMDQIDGPSLGDFSKPIQFERDAYSRDQDPPAVRVITIPGDRRGQWACHGAF